MVRFLLDEQLRGPLWQAIVRHNLTGRHPLDVTPVGDPPDLPLGSPDPDVLGWATKANRILVTEDRSTMRAYFERHLQAGQTSPGLFILRLHVQVIDVLDFLIAVTHASDPAEWVDQYRYVP